MPVQTSSVSDEEALPLPGLSMHPIPRVGEFKIPGCLELAASYPNHIGQSYLCLVECWVWGFDTISNENGQNPTKTMALVTQKGGRTLDEGTFNQLE